MAETVERHIQLPERRESAYRRSNKPLMEKKRRARINNCLGQLKALVLQAMRKDSNQYSKLEKADILEMTVKHLRVLQRQQISTAISQDPSVATKYRAGFNECANEVVRYLGSTQVVGEDIRSRLLNHLAGCMETTMHVQPVQKQEYQTCTQPLNVQIPYPVNRVQQTIPSGCLLMQAGVQASPLVLQSQIVQTQGPTQTSTQQHQMNTNVCNSFQIVQNDSSNGPVAVYLGQSPSQNQASQQIPTHQQMQHVKTVPTPPRTKASLKAFDNSAFKKVSHSMDAYDSSDSFSSKSLSPVDCRLDGLAISCTRTPSPLKEERVWRPW